ncbi:MAG: glycoside hydrolase family 127 protein [Planctomycetes bacterium]|nr:glycoside hydrolase family 127 protein [Planctomycetota bacterium]
MSTARTSAAKTKARPVLETPEDTTFALGGEIGRRLDAVTLQWVLPAPRANPAMLEMFRNRERRPLQNQVPWAGEFAGKYLTHAVQVHRLTRNPMLAAHIDWFVGEFTRLQDADGYLGPWPREYRMKKGCPTCNEPWDAWGHYHAMLGLLFWHHDTGDTRALDCARRIGDYFCDRFLDNPKEKLHDTGAHEMNQAPAHSLAMLYRVTGEKRYLAMARQIVREFALPPAGDYLRQGAAGKEFWETPKPRWESLHPIMALSELHYVTGDAAHKKAFENLWWSMAKGDRHNNGGFTSGEQATGNPYHAGAIETCCTIAWMAMSVEMLKLTGNSVVADEIEFSLLNSGIGMMSPSGRWVTYNTPMDGARRASAHDIVFQARPGSPELNCCSVNGPRALGMVSDWAVMRRGGAVVLNYYGPGVIETALPSGRRVRLAQNTGYPVEPRIDIVVTPDAAERFALALRIPYWSARTAVTVNGRKVGGVKAGKYLDVTRLWSPGDRVTVELDFSPHFWVKPYGPVADFEAEWTVFGFVPPTAAEAANVKLPPTLRLTPDPAGLKSVPRSLSINGRAYKPVKVRSERGIISGRKITDGLPGRMSLAAFTTIRSATARTIELLFTADWWTAWYVNGEKTFDNFQVPTGNTGSLDERCNKVQLKLRKGNNLVTLVIGGGVSRGAWASMGLAGVKPKRGPGLRDASIYRGPLLMTYDPRYNTVDPDALPTLDARRAADSKPIHDETWLKPQVLREYTATDGSTLALCDFGSAGAAGNDYITWLPVRFGRVPARAFSRTHPLMSFRVGK